jgi:tetratricopeptide (TPR) repeat protein
MSPSPEFSFLARIYKDPEAERKAFLNGDYERLAEKLLAYINALGPDSDPPLAKQIPTHIFYILRPVAGLIFEYGHYELADKLMAGYFDRFAGPDGRLPIPYDAAVNAQAFISLTRLKLGRFGESIASSERMIELDPSKGYSYFLLALAQIGDGQMEEALQSLSIAADKDATNPAIAVRYALLMAKQRSLAEASAFLAERARTLRMDGLANSAKALEYLATCLELPPEKEDYPGWLQIRLGAAAGQEDAT